jgi:hypothetical protein
MAKLTNFPAVNYITLYENISRMEFMNEQLTRYGIRHIPCLNHRYTTFQHKVNIMWPNIIEEHMETFRGFSHPGTIISYLTAMKNWYDTTNEEHVIFCDDDMSFESVDHWSFTWQEFLDMLPADWEAVHLVRINNWHVGLINNAIKFEIPSLKLRKKEWDDFGGAGLFKREYIKKILDRHWIDSLNFNFTIPCKHDPLFFSYATIENMLFNGLCDNVYNIPMLLEYPFQTTMSVERMLYSHDRSYEYYSTLWKMYGRDLPLRYIMNQT